MKLTDEVKRVADAAERLCVLFELYLKSQNVEAPRPVEELEPNPYRLSLYNPEREMRRDARAFQIRFEQPQLSISEAYEMAVQEEEEK